MPKIIDKEKKKRDIALASIDVFAQKGLQKSSVAEIAQSASIGKGTLYLYFANKEEIVLEIWEMVLEQRAHYLEEAASKNKSAQEKIIDFFSYEKFLPQDSKDKLLRLYQEFLGALLLNHCEIFLHKFREKIEIDIQILSGLLKEGIEREEFYEVESEKLALQLIEQTLGAVVVSKGFALDCERASEENIKSIRMVLQSITKEKR